MLHPRRLEHLLHLVDEGVVATIDDLLYAGVDDELRAGEAGGNRYVDRAARDGVAVVGGLADRVLLGVGAEAFLEMGPAFRRCRAARAAAGEAVLDAARSAVVAGGEDVVVLHHDRADAPAHAVAALRDDRRDLHEVLVPAWTRIFDLFGHWLDIIPLWTVSRQLPKDRHKLSNGTFSILFWK